MNEEAVGKAIAKSGVSREELFITTKLWVQDASYEGAKNAIETSLRKLGLEYLDLYLIHQPVGDYIGAYRAMEEAYKQGTLRAIGACNFYPNRLADFCETVDVIPAVDQVELHPFFQQGAALALMKEYGVHPEAWGPFAEGKLGIFTPPRADRGRAEVPQECRSGGTTLECTAWRHRDPEVRSQGTYGAEHEHLGFPTQRGGYETDCRVGPGTQRNCGSQRSWFYQGFTQYQDSRLMLLP